MEMTYETFGGKTSKHGSGLGVRRQCWFGVKTGFMRGVRQRWRFDLGHGMSKLDYFGVSVGWGSWMI